VLLSYCLSSLSLLLYKNTVYISSGTPPGPRPPSRVPWSVSSGGVTKQVEIILGIGRNVDQALILVEEGGDGRRHELAATASPTANFKGRGPREKTEISADFLIKARVPTKRIRMLPTATGRSPAPPGLGMAAPRPAVRSGTIGAGTWLAAMRLNSSVSCSARVSAAKNHA